MKKNIKEIFGLRVQMLRKERGLTQEQLADVTGFHRTYIGMIERGERNPSLINLQKFAEAFSITLSKLLEQCD